MKVRESWTSRKLPQACSGRERKVEALGSCLAEECFACYQLAPAVVDQAFAVVAFAADHWEDPFVDQEVRWAVVGVERGQVGSRDLVEVRSPCRSLAAAVEARIPFHILALHQAAQGSHAHRQGLESVDAAGTGSVADRGSQTAAVAAVAAGDTEAAVLGTDSAAGVAAGVACGMARSARVAKDAC